ncbi:MAG: hypothetical protein ACKVS5_04120 [Parvularculaceae bacterium]
MPQPAIIDAARAAKYRIVEADGAPGDIAIADLRGLDPASEGASDIVAAARRIGAGAGVLIAAAFETSSDNRRRLSRLGETIFLRDSPAPLIGAIRERLRLAALADEAGDRIKTLAADGRVVAFSPTPRPLETLRVLIAGKPSPIVLAASNAVLAGATPAACVFTAGQAMRALDHGGFDSAVFIPSDDNDLLIALARALRRHRDHSRLPVIIASDNEEMLERRAAKDGLDTMPASRLSEDLFRRLDTLTRRASMASSMRSFLRSPEGNGVAGGAASPRVFAQHAIRVLRRADQTGRAISFAALSLEPKNEAFTRILAKSALDDALRTATRLVRAEDMIARLTASTLIFMLRGTVGEDAGRVARRLEGVIAGTQARTTLDIADVRAAAIERAPGVEIERVVAALVSQLRKRSPAAATRTSA